MKIVALVPFRNEQDYLPLFMKSLDGLVDEVLGYDHESIDASRELFIDHGGLLIDREKDLASVVGATVEVRKRLLAHGRAIGGTHFLVIDCDEIIIGKAREQFRDISKSLSPGQFLSLPIVTSWQGFNSYIDYPDSRGPRHMRFLFADRKDFQYQIGRRFVHFERTPTALTESKLDSIQHDLGESAVLHLSYSSWDRAQMKQAWYRVMEREILGRDSKTINETYDFTLNSEPPVKYLDHLQLPSSLNQNAFENLASFDVTHSWHHEAIKELIRTRNRYKFLNLKIWHIDSLRAHYIQRFSREPRSGRISWFYEKWSLRLNHLLFVLRNQMKDLK